MSNDVMDEKAMRGANRQQRKPETASYLCPRGRERVQNDIKCTKIWNYCSKSTNLHPEDAAKIISDCPLFF